MKYRWGHSEKYLLYYQNICFLDQSIATKFDLIYFEKNFTDPAHATVNVFVAYLTSACRNTNHLCRGVPVQAVISSQRKHRSKKNCFLYLKAYFLVQSIQKINFIIFWKQKHRVQAVLTQSRRWLPSPTPSGNFKIEQIITGYFDLNNVQVCLDHPDPVQSDFR